MCSTSTGTDARNLQGGRATRRALLAGGLAAAGSTLLPRAAPAHTPYKQWKVYRQRHLVLGASREDEASYPLAKEIEAFLAAELPEASPRVARARTRRRLADLLSTDQLRVVLLSADDARALAEGAPPFRRPLDIRVLGRFGGHVLVVQPSFRADHAWVLAHTFDGHGDALPAEPAAEGEPPAPLHEGVRIALEGGPQPEVAADQPNADAR